jgi:SAM-dependent methyltransferase
VTTDCYAGAADGWASGAARVYGPLAAELVRSSPHPLRDRTVLDAGAGTGLGSAALAGAGARVVALDLSLDMLRWQRRARPPALVGDVTRLPLRDGAVDDVLAAFVLNHLFDPGAGLAELRRVTRPCGALLASVFAADSHSAARDLVDQVAVACGFAAPHWYLVLKAAATPLLGSAPAMRVAALAAGLGDVEVEQRTMDVGLRSAAELVDYRFGQAHYASWIAGLDPERRAAVRAAAIERLAPVMEPYRPSVVFLSARVP